MVAAALAVLAWPISNRGVDPETASAEFVPASPVPVFPLPGVFLFPGQLLPLHVFEPRYRQMVADLLDGPGYLVVGTVRGADVASSDQVPAVLPVAGLGEIARHERLADGRYHIWLLGRARVRIDELPSNRQYRLVRCQPFRELPVARDEGRRLRELLRAATAARVAQQLTIPADTPTGMLADLLTQVVSAPQPVVEEIFAEPSIAARARKALAAHAQFPPLPR